MKWENPIIEYNEFDKENIVTASSMTVEEAHDYVDIQGAERSFLPKWLEF